MIHSNVTFSVRQITVIVITVVNGAAESTAGQAIMDAGIIGKGLG